MIKNRNRKSKQLGKHPLLVPISFFYILSSVFSIKNMIDGRQHQISTKIFVPLSIPSPHHPTPSCAHTPFSPIASHHFHSRENYIKEKPKWKRWKKRWQFPVSLSCGEIYKLVRRRILSPVFISALLARN